MYTSLLHPSSFFFVLPPNLCLFLLPSFPLLFSSLLFSSPPQPSSYCPPFYSSLVLKCGTAHLNINLLFIHIVLINLPTILPLNHHWNNLATNIPSLHTLHSRDNMLTLSPAFHSYILHMHGKVCTLIPELY